MRYWLLPLVLLLAGACSGSPGNGPAEALQNSSTNAPSPIADNLDPSDLVRQFDQLQRTRLPGRTDADGLDLFATKLWSALHIPDPSIGRCDCRELLLEEIPPHYSVLRLATSTWEYRFMVFTQTGDKSTAWRFEGFADTFSKYGKESPSARLEATSIGTFLAVPYSTGGTGVLNNGEAWFDLNPSRSREVLRFPTLGHESPYIVHRSGSSQAAIGRKWTGGIVSRTSGPRPAIGIGLTIDYEAIDATSPGLFSRKQTGVFKWDTSSRTYRLDEQLSTVTAAEMETLTEAAGERKTNLHGFLQYNTDALSQLVRNGTPEQKSLVRTVLQTAGNDPLAAAIPGEIAKLIPAPQNSKLPLPKDAEIIEVRPLSIAGYPERALVLWMVSPSRRTSVFQDDHYYTCPEQTLGSHWLGPARVSLVDIRSNTIVNTVELRNWYGEDSLALPYAMAKNIYYSTAGESTTRETLPIIMWLRDYTGEGKPLQFALYFAESCMGLQTAVIGFLPSIDLVEQYTWMLKDGKTGKEETSRWIQRGYLGNTLLGFRDHFRYTYDYSGRCMNCTADQGVSEFEIRFNRTRSRFEGTVTEHGPDRLLKQQ